LSQNQEERATELRAIAQMKPIDLGDGKCHRDRVRHAVHCAAASLHVDA
jgi:hypothetical protein